jgi:glucosylceramidase
MKNIKKTPFFVIFFVVIMLGLLPGLQCQVGEKTEDKGITVYSSSLDGDRLTEKEKLYFTKNEDASYIPVIAIDEDSTFQKIDGFGASFNEAGMICLNSLKPENREKVLEALFDPTTGAGFSLMKSPMATCDFTSAGPWFSYNDTPEDTMMKNFSVERDLAPAGQITFIKNAQRFGKFDIQACADFLADWMYFDYTKRGKRHIKPEYYGAVARYFANYIKEYERNGVEIKYLNLFNEPMNYSDCTYLIIADMMKKTVGPHFKAEGLTTQLNLGETMSRSQGLEEFPPVLSDPELRKWVSGPISVHGYDWNSFEAIDSLHKLLPDFQIWMTEVCYAIMCCVPPGGPNKVPVYEFSDGEFWGNMIMNDMKHQVSGWIYWNMILDENGGPWIESSEHYSAPSYNNRQHPVVIINRNTKEITYTGLYYYLGHFSKFVKPGAYRINCVGGSPQHNFAGFLNPDGSIVINIINNGDESDCKIQWHDKSTIKRLKAHSITTVKWNLKEFEENNK